MDLAGENLCIETLKKALVLTENPMQESNINLLLAKTYNS